MSTPLSKLWSASKWKHCGTTSFFFILIITLVGLGTSNSNAQANPNPDNSMESLGFPPFSEQVPVEMGNINVANGNLHIEIPLGSFPQRGQSGALNPKLVYDSAIWTQDFGFQPLIGNALGTGSPYLTGWRYVTSQSAASTSYPVAYQQICNLDSQIMIMNWFPLYFYDAAGTQHAFPVFTQHGYKTKCGDNTGSTKLTADAVAIDGSGYHAFLTPGNTSIYAPDGSLVLGTWNGLGPNLNLEDTNGNYPSNNEPYGNYNLIDTLGRLPVSKTVSGSNVYFDVLNSQGTTSRYTVAIGSTNVYTNFKSAGATSNDFRGSFSGIQSIQLPDGTSYSFQYDSGTAQGHYGQLTSMTLPTGAQISYTYANFADAQFFNRGGPHITRGVSTRHTPDGTWTLTPQLIHSCMSGSSGVHCAQTMTIQEPSGDNTVYTYIVGTGFAYGGSLSLIEGGAWPIGVQYYNGGVAPGNLLYSSARCYSFVTVVNGQCDYTNAPSQTSNYVKLTAESRTVSLPNGTNISSTTEYTWDSNHFGNITQKSDWLFYSGTLPAVADRTTTYSYLNSASYLSANITNRPTNITVTDKSSNHVAQTIDCYDYAGGCGGSSFASVTGVAQHDDYKYGASNTVRGDLTQVKRLVSGASNYLTTSETYDSTGQVTSATDSNGNITTFLYADRFFNDAGDTSNPSAYTPPGPTNAYLTTQTQGALTSTFGYYWAGQKAQVTDPNSQTSYAHFYDRLDRPTSTKQPDGGWTYSVYPTASETQWDTYVGMTGATLTTTCPSTSPICRHDHTLLDSLGRVTSKILISDPDGQTTVSTAYDANGRVQKRSNPYRSISDPTYGWETPGYDGLNRVIQVTRPDGSIARTYYGASVSSGGGATVQLCSASTYGLGYPVLNVDEAGKIKQTWTDGFGRLIEADEPDPTGALTVATCYTYDLTNNLTGVMQGTQIRSYQYDLLSRLTQAKNPESGTIAYSYVNSSGALCSGDPSNVCSKTALAPNQPPTGTATVITTYTYDTLNRLTQRSYSDGVTPTAMFGYDQASVTMGTQRFNITNSIGRLSWECTIAPTTCPTINAFSYDKMGRTAQLWQCQHLNCPLPNIVFSYDYDLIGDELDYFIGTVPPGSTEYVSTYSSAGRLTSFTTPTWVDSTNPANLLTGVHYDAFGHIISGNLANGLSLSSGYDARSRVTAMAVGTTCSVGNCSTNKYRFTTGYAPNSDVVSSTDTVNGNWTYTYDDLNRLSTGVANNGEGCSWDYDRYGNRLHQNAQSGSCTTSQYSFSGNNNRIDGDGYDAAGNLLNDGFHTYKYDAENRIVSVDGGATTYIYDAEGRRYSKTTGGVPEETIYDRMGNPRIRGNFAPGEIFVAGMHLGTYIINSGHTDSIFYYDHSDWLGTERARTDLSGTACEKITSLPFGDNQTITSTCGDISPMHFTGKERDTESGLDNFGARYYGSRLGRFMRPDDPFADQDTGDPQSWNLYSYVRNNPLSNTDPSGNACVQGSDGKWSDDNSGGETCAQVDVNNAVTGPSVTVQATTDDVSYQLANAVANLTSTSSLSEVGVNGILGAQMAEGIWSLPSLFRSGADLIASWRMASKMAGVRAAGETGEALAGIVKNTERIPSLSGTAAYRVPDILDNSAKVIGEVKNYNGTVSLTAQIKDDIAFAQQNGYTMVLKVSQSTQLSQPLQQLVTQGTVKLVRF
jgi:RHS repeat-associated protein